MGVIEDTTITTPAPHQAVTGKQGDLYINLDNTNTWIDAFKEWGVRMGDGFMDEIDKPLGLKDFVTDESRLIHGKRMIVDDIRFESRDFSLSFVVCATNKSFDDNKHRFMAELYKGNVKLFIPILGDFYYNLVYTGKSITYAVTPNRSMGIITANFSEPDPTNRPAALQYRVI